MRNNESIHRGLSVKTDFTKNLNSTDFIYFWIDVHYFSCII